MITPEGGAGGARQALTRKPAAAEWQKQLQLEAELALTAPACQQEFFAERRLVHTSKSYRMRHTAITAKIDPRMSLALRNALNIEEEVGFLLKLSSNADDIVAALHAAGFATQTTLGHMRSGRARVADVYCIAALPAVVRIEGGGRYSPE